MAIVKTYLENLKYRTRRDSDIDPWSLRDLFRMNHMPLKEVTLVKGDDETVAELWVQYVKENIFNVYSKDENGWFVPVILDAECEISEDKKDTVIVRTDHHSF